MDRELYQQIVSEYRKSGSVDITAKACGTYPIKVRKVLITEGIWHSRKSDAVNALRKRGYSVPEIAEELGMDEKNVQFYLPYTESSLSGEKSDTGERVRSFRERSRNAAEGSAAREKEMESPANDPVNRLEKGPVKYPTEERDLFFGGSRSVSMAESARPFGGSQREIWTGYMLRAEMVSFSCDPDCDCTDIFDGGKDAEILKTLLKSRNGIIRDLIVPGTMTLHQLSYALQKAFGFQNCHLHHFEFPKKLLWQLTGNRTKDWAELCGVYLHAPVDEDFEDLYWDDDYREGKSPNAWMRSKYTGEAADYAVGETYIDTLRLMKKEREWVQMHLDEKKDPLYMKYEDLPLEVHAHEYYPEGNLTRVLERLKIEDLFWLEPLAEEETEAWRKRLQDSNKTSRQYLQACSGTLSFRSLAEALDTLRFLREERHAVDQKIWLRRNGIREETGSKPEELLDELDREIRELEHHLGDAMHVFDPPAEPVTDTLYYCYDYGDDWLIRVTCKQIFVRNETLWEADADPEEIFLEAGEKRGFRDPELEKGLHEHLLQRDFSDEYEYEDTDGNLADEKWRSALIRAELNKEPVCIAAEGLSLVEDVGGIGGFFRFLETIHGEDAEEAARMRQWARGLGWKEVRPRPESLL